MLLVGSHLLSLADAANLRRLNRLAEAMMQRLDLALQAAPVAALAIGSSAASLPSKQSLATQAVGSPESGDRALNVVGDGVAKAGVVPARTSSEARRRIAELEREIGELQQANGVLQTLAVFRA